MKSRKIGRFLWKVSISLGSSSTDRLTREFLRGWRDVLSAGRLSREKRDTGLDREHQQPSTAFDSGSVWVPVGSCKALRNAQRDTWQHAGAQRYPDKSATNKAAPHRASTLPSCVTAGTDMPPSCPSGNIPDTIPCFFSRFPRDLCPARQTSPL